MSTTEIQAYIQKARDYGLADDEIKKNLIASGWDKTQVEQAFLKPTPAPQATPAAIPGAPTILQSGVTPAPAKKPLSAWLKKPVIIIPLVVIVLLIAGGVAASLSGFSLANFGFIKPEKVWDSFSKKESAKIYQMAYTLTYTDTGSVGPSEGVSSELSNISVAVNGNGYLNITDSTKPESQSDLQYTFKSGNTSFSTGVKYRIKDNIFYLNVGENPFLNAIFNSGADGKKYDWVKLDLKAAKDQASSLDSGLASDINNTQQYTQLKQIWDDAKFLQLKKYVGKEKVGDTNTLHFTADLDKQGIKTALDKIIDSIADNSTEKPSDKDRQTVKDIADSLVDKLEVKQFDLWIGQKDFELYKVYFVSNAPAVTDIIKASNEAMSTAAQPTQSIAAEGKRVEDIEQVRNALELFHKDKGAYPSANRGVPQGLVPEYLAAMPISPAATGNCSDFYNTYWYVTDGDAVTGKDGEQLHSSYKMTFCLGHDAVGYKAGVGIATPSGITTTTVCPNPLNNCFIESPRNDEPQVIDTTASPSEDQIKAIINRFVYNATITYEGTFSNYGKTVPIEIPQESLDLLEMFKNKVEGTQPPTTEPAPVPDSSQTGV